MRGSMSVLPLRQSSGEDDLGSVDITVLSCPTTGALPLPGGQFFFAVLMPAG